MPSTITVQQTLNWTAPFVVQRPTSGINGIANEPALTSANKIIAAMVAAPLRWNWNRAQIPTAFTTTPGTSDYTISIPNYGYLEKTSLFLSSRVGPNNTPAQTFEIEVWPLLATDTEQNEPAKISAIIDDGAGNITFRLLPVPDNAYVATLTYQKSAILLTQLSQPWAPVPDKYAYIYETAMVAHMQGMYNMQAYFTGMELFFRMLVAAAEGMTESEKAMFLEDMLRDVQARSTASLSPQYGKQARQ